MLQQKAFFPYVRIISRKRHQQSTVLVTGKMI